MKRLVAAICLWLLPLTAFAGQGKVFVYNWAEYMPDEVLTRFQKETGIKVVYTTYDNNEAMFAKVKLIQGDGYDIVVPSTYYVDRMRRQEMLLPLDKSKLPNLVNLDRTLLDKPYDPGNRYSVPYLWGSTALAVNTDHVKPDSVTSMADLWKPEYQGRVLLVDDVREVFGMSLRLLGHSCNSTDPAQIEQAYDKLRALMPNVRLFSADSPKQPFLNQEVHIGQIWNGEAYMAAQEDPRIVYLYPKEGPMLWLDSMVIPKSARNVENAHRFIDFILRPEIAKIICEAVGYSSPNKKALSLLDPAVRDNPTVYPTEETVQKGEFQTDVGEAMLVYEKFWEKLKSGK